MFCFIPVPPWIVDGHVRWSCGYSYEDWREEPSNQSKNTSLTWGKRNNSHDFHVATWNLFRKYSWPCSHFNSELFRRLFDEVIGEGRQSDHSTGSSEVFGSWLSSKLQDSHGEQGIVVYMVQNIDAHMGEKCFLPKRLEDFSLTSTTSRTIPCNVCENFHGFWESRCYENNVCSHRLTHLCIHEDYDILHVHCQSNHFSQCPTFLLSHCCGDVDVKTRWFLQNLSSSDHAGFNPGTMRVSANGTKDDSWGWRFTLLIFQSHKWHFCWTNLTSEREPIEDDEERLAMKIGLLPQLSGQFLIWGYKTIKHWTNSARTRKRCTLLHLLMITHKHGLVKVDHLSSHILRENR